MGDYNRIESNYEVPVPGGSIFLRGRLTNRVKAQFEDWLEAQARKRVFAMREHLEPEEFRESMQAVVESCASGALSWGGAACQSALKQVPGVAKLLALLANDAKDIRQSVDEAAILKILTIGASVETNGDGKFRVVSDGQVVTEHDAEEAAVKECEERQQLYESGRAMLVQAVKDILTVTPNFLSPPVRGKAD